MKYASIILWIPRILGIILVLLTSLFAFDAFEKNATACENLQRLLIHLVPAFLVMILVAIAWKYPLTGELLFILLSLVCACFASDHASWIVQIGLPVLLLGGSFIRETCLR